MNASPVLRSSVVMSLPSLPVTLYTPPHFEKQGHISFRVHGKVVLTSYLPNNILPTIGMEMDHHMTYVQISNIVYVLSIV